MLCAAGPAPRGPEVHNDYFPEQRRKLELIAFQRTQRELHGVAELRIGIQSANLRPVSHQLSRGPVVSLKNDIAQTGLTAFELLVQLAHAPAIFRFVRVR